jgi:hypothetical protein
LVTGDKGVRPLEQSVDEVWRRGVGRRVVVVDDNDGVVDGAAGSTHVGGFGGNNTRCLIG